MNTPRVLADQAIVFLGQGMAGRICVTWLACLILGGCESSFNHGVADAAAHGDASGDAGVQFAGIGIGGKCATDDACRSGLRCKSATCQAIGATANNGSCLLTAECAAGLHCGWSGFCTPQPGGAVVAGQACQKTADCAGGLYCALVPGNTCASGGTCGVCKVPGATAVPPAGEECTSAAACPPGMVCDLLGLSGTCKLASGKNDLGVACVKSDDCLAGLACSPAQKKCVPGSLLLDPDLYSGVECDDAEASTPFQAVVHLPRPGTATEFYALPFPNDILRKNGHLDVSAHPHPGLGLVGFDLVAAVQQALAQEMTGWGLTTGMYVRFTRAVNPASLLTGANGNVRLVNLKTGADVPINVRFETRRNKYICGNWLYAHTPWGTLLTPDTPYVLLVNDAISLDKGEQGDPHPVPAADMVKLVADTAPSEAAIADAWKLYAPVRAWLKKSGLSAKKVVAAALFTTWEPRTAMPQLADVALNKAVAPGFSTAGSPVVCGPNVHSPCQTPNWAASAAAKLGPDPRDCPQTVNPTFVEIHAKIQLPYFQTGTRPYLHTGGALNLDAAGKAALVDYEPVCVAITLPKKPMPAAGWPLLVFAHGTGGSFRSAVDGVAGMVAGVPPPGMPVPETVYATLAIDQPMHANRRGEGVDADPGPLFYNFANPPAARGNFSQGAADNFSLFRFALATKDKPLAINGVQGGVKFDPANLVYMGHSQGGTTGPMFLPYMPGLKGAVLSGCGGSLVYGLLGKKKPYDASIGLRIALQDAQINEFHPVLNLLQLYFEASDPLLYAPLLFQAPLPSVGPLNVLHTYGMNDSFTPVATSRIFAAATGGTLGRPGKAAPAWFDAMADLAMPVAALDPGGISGNITIAGKKVTGVTIEASNDAKTSLYGNAYDGHFVAFNDKDTVRRVLTFLVTLVKGIPTVVD